MTIEPKVYRRIIHISAEDSPNVRYARAQLAAGIQPTNEEIVPGVIGWEQYQYRLATWDKVRQHIGLFGRFWEDASTLMYPPQWLNRAERLALLLKGRTRIARGMGVDPAEGGDSTSICIVDELGIIELISHKTPNTDVIVSTVLDKILQYQLDPKRVLFDRGGGGKQHADRLRAMGYNVRTIGFGDSPHIEPKRGMTQFNQKLDVKERKYAYFNKRAEMYGDLRILLDPGSDERDYGNEQAYEELKAELLDKGRIVGNITGFAIPHTIPRLRDQLSVIPFKYDNESRMRLPPKNKRDPNSREQTLIDIIGHSPDEADSLVLAVQAMLTANTIRNRAG